jgi:hypothetical protein
MKQEKQRAGLAPTPSYVRYEDLRDEEEIGSTKLAINQRKTDYQKKLEEVSYSEAHTISNTDACFERFVDIFLIASVSVVVIFFVVLFYYDSLPINKINSIVIINSFLPPTLCHQIIQISELYAKEHSWTTSRHRNYPTTDVPVFYLNDFNISINLLSGSEQDKAIGKEIPFVKWLNHTIERQIFPLMSDAFQIPIEETLPDDLSEEQRREKRRELSEFYVKDLFLVKYDATNPDSQNFLEKHIDSSLLTFSLSLSSPASEVRHILEDRDRGESTRDAADIEEIRAHSYEGGGTKFYLSERVETNYIGSLMLHNSRVYHEGIKITKGRRYIIVGFVNIRLKQRDEEVATKSGWWDRWRRRLDFYTNDLYARKFGDLSHCIERLSYIPREESTTLQHHLLYHRQQLPVVRLDEFYLTGKPLPIPILIPTPAD